MNEIPSAVPCEFCGAAEIFGSVSSVERCRFCGKAPTVSERDRLRAQVTRDAETLRKLRADLVEAVDALNHACRRNHDRSSGCTACELIDAVLSKHAGWGASYGGMTGGGA